jgi:hypothetical protein
MSVTRLLAHHFFLKCKIKSETTGKRTEANILKKKKIGMAMIGIGEAFQSTEMQYFQSAIDRV